MEGLLDTAVVLLEEEADLHNPESECLGPEEELEDTEVKLSEADASHYPVLVE